MNKINQSYGLLEYSSYDEKDFQHFTISSLLIYVFLSSVMDKKHRDLLRKNRISLVQDLEATQLLSYLYQEDILSENDRDSIKAEKTRGAKAEKLLDILPRRGKKAFDVFCQALATTDGQGHLVDLLKPNESISSGN